jgi:hypothetical protein
VHRVSAKNNFIRELKLKLTLLVKVNA